MSARACPIMHDRQGLAAVEFALILPMLLVLFLGGVGLSDAIACNRKVTTAARAVADLASRYSSVSASDLTLVLNASAQVMAPYNVANATVRVSEVKVTGASSAQVVWSQARNGTALTTGETVTLPNNMAATNSYLILGQVSYAYVPTVPWAASQATTLYDAVFMSPRLSDQVPLQ